MHRALKFCPANRCFVLDQKEYEQRKIWVEHTDSTDEYESDEEEEEEGKDNTNLDGCEVLLYAEQFDKLIANVPLSYGNIKVQNFQLCLNAFDQLNCLTFYQVPTRTSWSLEEGDSNAKHDQLLNVQWAGKQIGTEKMTISETQLLVANPQHCYRLCLQQHEQNSTFCQAFQACRYPSSSRWKYTCDFLSLDQLTLLLSSEHDQHKTLLVDNHHCSVYRPNARNHFVQLNQVSIQSDLKPIKVDRDVELIEECIDKCWNRMGNQCRTLIAKLESTDNLNETVIIKRDQHQECQYFNQELFNVNLAQNRQQKLSHSSNSVAFISEYLASK